MYGVYQAGVYVGAPRVYIRVQDMHDVCVWAQDVIEYAIYLGINPRKEAHLLFIAQVSIIYVYVCIYRCMYVCITYTHTYVYIYI